MINNFKIKKDRGFTLVEAMTAIFILTFAIVGLMSIVSSSLFAARYARDDITVNYLLQEAVDYIRNDRDTGVFMSSGAGTTETLWNNFYNRYSNCTLARGCTVDVLKDVVASPKQCPTGGCPYLYFNPNPTNSAFYVTEDGSSMTGMVKSKYQRKITVTRDVLSPDQINVTVRIDWKNGNLDKTRTLTTSLARWQE